MDLNALKSEAGRRYSLVRSPKLVEIIAAVPEEHRAVLLPQLRAKPVRTASGIAVVAVMSKPHRCPHIATTGAPHAALSSRGPLRRRAATCGLCASCRRLSSRTRRRCRCSEPQSAAWELACLVLAARRQHLHLLPGRPGL